MCVSGRESSCSAPSVDVDRAFDDCSSRWPVKAAPRNPAACAATCLPRRAGVPPTATWRVQPERTLRLFLPRRQWRLAVDVARRAERRPCFYRSSNDEGTSGDPDGRAELILALVRQQPG